MRLHEYQAKSIFSDGGIPIPPSGLANSVETVLEETNRIGYPAVIKAQVHVGGRGKAGGITLVQNDNEAEIAANKILGMDLKGYLVYEVLVEQAIDFVDEIYLGVTLDRSSGMPVAMVSSEGGIDIEQVASSTPDAISKTYVNPLLGLSDSQAKTAVLDAGISPTLTDKVANILLSLYNIWETSDATETEINPLMVSKDGDVIATDAVLNIEDDALFRQKKLADLRDIRNNNKLESKADLYGFNYVRLDGNIGIIGNGAGLVMTTLDLVDHYGGKPANFLDIGGGANSVRVENALEILFEDENVDSILFNIFGGITRGDEVAQGINDALENFDTLPKPIVVRLDGTNAKEGMEILNTDHLTVESTLESAVQRAIELASKGGD
ncbi:MAG TPA: ADP-forming succinate--CoA ligase subunit beta [Halobacteriales archaeon]|uniref:ADP-forming succinate--CoA ligase subunit beta n=1 Tax=Candidatus Hikarchaeum yamanae TaxID=2675326 RepID=UPI00179186FF|nr:ADP-forming succinate--CoA ligase subunit beta [Halobacteriales archaeon]|tara:strand:+ start:161753 stop:162898 length:1146 start_codon:yes stop_codon:yes gene_type:complete